MNWTDAREKLIKIKLLIIKYDTTRHHSRGRRMKFQELTTILAKIVLNLANQSEPTRPLPRPRAVSYSKTPAYLPLPLFILFIRAALSLGHPSHGKSRKPGVLVAASNYTGIHPKTIRTTPPHRGQQSRPTEISQPNRSSPTKPPK